MGWLLETGKTVGEALGVRKYVIGTTSAAGAAVATAVYGWLRSEPGWGWLPALPHWSAFILVLISLLMIFITNYATKLRKELEPKFDLSFGGKGLGVVESVEHQRLPREPGMFLIANGRHVRVQINSRSRDVVPGLLPFITGVQYQHAPDSGFIDIHLPQKRHVSCPPRIHCPA